MNTATRTSPAETEISTGFRVIERDAVKVNHFDPEDLVDDILGTLGTLHKGDIAHAVIVLEIKGGRRLDYCTVVVNDFSESAPKGYADLVANEICAFTRTAAGQSVSAYHLTLVV